MSIKYLSVCSGIEAATAAWHGLGWEPLAFSEIEAFPRAVLAHHYPDVPLHGDFTVLREQPWIMNADVLVGGTPCQAFSVAGLRNSLADERGNLSLEFVRLANAIDAIRHVPAVIVWENVPGVLSVKDNAFGCFLAGLAGEDTPIVPSRGKWTNAGLVIGPKRTVAWRILDAQYFGVAQRRRRVFVVASARKNFDPAAVLFECEGVRRNTPPRREAGQKVAGCLTKSPSSSSSPNVGSGQGNVVEVAGTLTARGPFSMGFPEVDGGHVMPVADVIGTLNHSSGHAVPGNSLQDAGAGMLMPVSFHPTQDPISSTDGTTHALGCGSSGGQASVAVAFGGDIARTLSARHDSSPCADRGMDVVAVAQPIDFRNLRYHEGNVSGTMQSKPNGGYSLNYMTGVQQCMAVRRLTPVECERLQGFPDDYTLIPWRKKAASECPDGPRYKALGNSMAVPVMRWIGNRINFELGKGR